MTHYGYVQVVHPDGCIGGILLDLSSPGHVLCRARFRLVDRTVVIPFSPALWGIRLLSLPWPFHASEVSQHCSAKRSGNRQRASAQEVCA